MTMERMYSVQMHYQQYLKRGKNGKKMISHFKRLRFSNFAAGYTRYEPNKRRFCETFVVYGDGGDWGRYGIQVIPSGTKAFLFKGGKLTMKSIWVRRLEG